MRGYGLVRPVVLRFPVRLLEALDREIAATRYSSYHRADRTFFLLRMIAGELGIDLREAKPLTVAELAEIDAKRLERRRERARARAAAR